MVQQTEHYKAKQEVNNFEWNSLEQSDEYNPEAKILGYPTAQSYAQAIVDCAYASGYVEGKPYKSISASAVYAAAKHFGYEITVKNVQEQIEISETTVRNNYKDLLAMVDPNTSVVLLNARPPQVKRNPEEWH